MRRMLTTVVLMLLPHAVHADDARRIVGGDELVEIVDGRALTRFGIRLTVFRDGRITGRAFGGEVTGQWAWKDGYFCRTLFFGQKDLGPNCQLVTVSGDVLRFVADRGKGDYADFTLR